MKYSQSLLKYNMHVSYIRDYMNNCAHACIKQADILNSK